ncbi:hypothetical protein PUR49_05340 [Streptomyces sp. BE147]|uniref:hypothetical protein n=1 Tax=Streptomyces sp. BE147 TaxID=3002524 RepID=UPI002E7679B0|nr:hypothetical protein [Streptomyces sp. BE147]MEE1735939.1 hypothetical protein [Streptomyces sp. BE147]
MRIRQDIADLLREGVPQQDIMRTLHVGHNAVSETRVALQLPAPVRGGRPLQPIETAFYARTEPVDDGHLRWTGHHANGVPRLGRQGKHPSAYQVGFQLHHRREPVGHAKPGCGWAQCVAPAHQEDRPMREQLRAQLVSIFGGAL